MSEKKDFFSLDPDLFLDRVEKFDISNVDIPDQTFEKEIPLIKVEPVGGNLRTIRDKKGKDILASSMPAQTLKGMDGLYYISLKNDSGEYIWYLLK